MSRHAARSYRTTRRCLALGLILLLQFSTASVAFSQIKISGPTAGGKPSAKNQNKKKAAASKDGKSDPEIIPEKITAENSGTKSSAEIMQDQASRGIYKTPRELFRESGIKRKKERPDRSGLPQNSESQLLSKYPASMEDTVTELAPTAPQTIGLNFDTVTGPTETGAFPPDTMGAAGPTQFFVFLNGRLRTFNKSTGAADGAINVDSDVFFASVMTPPNAGEVVFSTDPNVRFDRLSNRWFLNIIDAPVVSATGALSRPNRMIIAVSDAASNGTITGSTVWTFYQFQGDATLFTDYQSFGVDASAMYIGANMFTIAGAFNSTKGWVIPKAPALTGSPLTVWAFSGLVATGTGAGPFSPRGVDNYNPANTGATAEGYFIGVDNATFGTLMMRRVTNPGSLGPAPTISANVSITVNATQYPNPVTHAGNTGGANGRLDSLDDRLYAAHLRNGRLWTAHNIRVNATGVASTVAAARNAVRWYELTVPPTTGTPTVTQSGTIFDSAATLAAARQYWIPSVMVSGQGHAAFGYSTAGTSFAIDAATNGRLAGDPLGTLGAVSVFTASSTAYNPPGDPGGAAGRRWGDYSYTSLDPLDDMTMWTIQQ